MTLHPVLLFVHVTAVFVLCAMLSFEALSLFHLRRASNWADARPWIEPIRRASLFVISSLLIILFTGFLLVIPIAKPGQVWPRIAAISLLSIAPVGALTGKRMRAIRKAFRQEKAFSSELSARLCDPFLKLSLSVRVALFLGIFMLVNFKPGLGGSLLTIGGFSTLGLLVSRVGWGRTVAPVPNAGLGD
jgi:hypothetical protein